MEFLKEYITQTLPRYLENLPLPDKLEGFMELTGAQWLDVGPMLMLMFLMIVVIPLQLVASLFGVGVDPTSRYVNKSLRKKEAKVVDTVSLEDIKSREGDKVTFCRCYKSKNFPYCDGSHNQHNKETGDNVGPLIITK